MSSKNKAARAHSLFIIFPTVHSSNAKQDGDEEIKVL